MTDFDLYGDDEHPAAYNDEPTPILTDDPEWTSRAAWHLRRIAEWEHRKHEMVRAFEKEMDRLSVRLGEEAAKLDAKAAWHRKPLVQYHEAVLTADPTRKTIVVPGGKLCSRTPVKADVSFSDKEPFIDWARVHAPHLIEPTWKPAVKQIEKAIAAGELVPTHTPEPGDPAHLVNPETGEQVPGVHLGKKATTFFIRLDEEGEF